MRICLVTGAASGIGAALVRELLGAGDTVVATDVDEAAGAALAADLQSLARYVVARLGGDPPLLVFPRWYRLVWWLWRWLPGAFLRSQRRRASGG